MSNKPTGTVKSAKQTAEEKGKKEDDGKVSRSKHVTSVKTVKTNPGASGYSERAPGGKTEGV